MPFVGWCRLRYLITFTTANMWGRVCWECPCHATGASCNISSKKCGSCGAASTSGPYIIYLNGVLVHNFLMDKRIAFWARTSSFNIFHCFELRTDWKGHRFRRIIRPNNQPKKTRSTSASTQNISNEPQSNTSKWDMGNTWTIVSTASATCEGNSFWFHAHCCAIIVRRGKLQIKWAKTFSEILDMSPWSPLFVILRTSQSWTNDIFRQIMEQRERLKQC